MKMIKIKAVFILLCFFVVPSFQQECIPYLNYTKCHSSCETCIPVSMCENPNMCMSCRVGHYKIAASPLNRRFQCSNTCSNISGESFQCIKRKGFYISCNDVYISKEYPFTRYDDSIKESTREFFDLLFLLVVCMLLFCIVKMKHALYSAE